MENSKILITGGSGSFGSTMIRRLLSENASEIRVLSRDEKKQDDLRKKLNSPRVKFYLGDVRDLASVHDAVQGVDYVFHAAALKQVPSCDFFPQEAVKTNIQGAANVLSACKSFGVTKAVVLSTDKAVYPINAMGMTKALMEKVMIAESRNCGKLQVLCGTRYGNVIASRGSVIPLFIQQIRERQEITITNPDMTRFLMSLDRAIELVLFAFHNGTNGDIFVQKSPAASVLTIAKAVIQLLGETEKSVQIKCIGTRHGEKKHETLVSQEDMHIAEDLEHYYRIPSDNRCLNYSSYFSEGSSVAPLSPYASDSHELLSVESVVDMLSKNAEVRSLLEG